MKDYRRKEERSTYVDHSEHLSHKFVTVRRRQRAVAMRVRMLYGLDDRSAHRGLDERRCAIGLHVRRGG